MDMNTLVAAAMIMAAVGGLAWVFVYPILSGDRRAEKRQRALVARGPAVRTERVTGGGQNRREQIAQSLKEVEARKNAQNRVTIEQRLARAGLDWPPSRFYLLSAGLGVVLALLGLLLTRSLLVAGLAGFVGAFGLPRWLLGHRAKKRIAGFIEELPNAIDIIVRGIRSGLPLGDCIREIAINAREPIRTEFRHVMESQAIGIPLSEAIQKMAERVPIPEANFFAIAIGIQSKAGGNLSEALGNLSRVLRERRRMRGKIKAMSMEAKASAAIIASLPFLVALLTYLTSPDYISLLWTTGLGRIVLGCCALWMAMGVLVMRNMINFEI
ncbi:type II secretion system F family protein [Salinarimonas sp.]|uniref:type II secretion system F family protein n=1 Tax=Salinarimonas sp. TaxID=2766526 RepID=UPI0032D99186